MLSQNHPWRLSALVVVICLLTACASTPQIAANTDPGRVETVHYKVGTANIDVVDASKRKWCGKGGPRAS